MGLVIGLVLGIKTINHKLNKIYFPFIKKQSPSRLAYILLYTIVQCKYTSFGSGYSLKYLFLFPLPALSYFCKNGFDWLYANELVTIQITQASHKGQNSIINVTVKIKYVQRKLFYVVRKLIYVVRILFYV